jgi:xanthine dehydrogenase accessory factor
MQAWRAKMRNDLEHTIENLRKAGKPFALATVVRAEKPTSAKAGSKAVITEEGRLIGWIGGSCAEPSVKRETKRALKDGLPRLIRLSPAEKLGKTPQEGVIEIPLTCISGGTLDIYIEPQLAQPHLVVIGHLATAEALVSLGKGMGWRVSLMGLDVDRERFPDADVILDQLDFSQLTIAVNIRCGGEARATMMKICHALRPEPHRGADRQQDTSDGHIGLLARIRC